MYNRLHQLVMVLMLQEESENMEKVVVTTVSLAYTNPDTANLDTAV